FCLPPPLSSPLFPYTTLFRSTISGRLMIEALGGWSAWVWLPLLVVAGVGIGLLLVGRHWEQAAWLTVPAVWPASQFHYATMVLRSEEHTSELQSRGHLVCRLL